MQNVLVLSLHNICFGDDSNVLLFQDALISYTDRQPIIDYTET
jgi:hypothetical protein